MKKSAVPVSVILVLALLAGCAPAAGSSTSPSASMPSSVAGSQQTKNDDEVWEIVRDAWVFSFPLVILDATARVSTNTVEANEFKAPLNQFIHSRQLADAAAREVVSPNVDTLYSQAFLDLSETALVFHKPAADRFLSVELLDAYTNCAAILGTGGDGQEAQTYLLTGPGWTGEAPEGMEQVPLPTGSGWLLVRTMVEDEADLDNVYALQAEMALLPLEAYQAGGEYRPPAGSESAEDESVPVEEVLSLSPQEYFTRANERMAANAPAAADTAMVARMEEIGVGPGLAFDAAGLGEEAEARWQDMLAGITDELLAATAPFQRTLGAWQFYGEPIAEFGTEYDYRALVALDGLGANPVSVAIYPKAGATDDGAALNGENRYVLHFEKDGLPPTLAYGFWSITAYGEDNVLIDNEIDRYLINDRSELAYNEDGSLDLYLQADPPADPNLQANWLPVNAQPFHLYLRIYLPDVAALGDGWQAPQIRAAE